MINSKGLVASSMQVKENAICSYLISLAAFQKGFKVRFIREPRNFYGIKANNHSYFGSIFSVSNGKSVIHFDKSRSDAVKKSTNRLIANKNETKSILLAFGCKVPQGMVVQSDCNLYKLWKQIKEILPVVVKPIAGSMGDGVYTDISEFEDLKLAIENQTSKEIIIESHIYGNEYRAFVCGNEVTSILKREKANVIGDGVNDIDTLIELKNQKRKQNPHLRNRLIKVNDDLKFILKKNYKLTLNSVPEENKVIYLANASNFSLGGESIECIQDFSDSLKDSLVRANASVGLPYSGVDFILCSKSGELETVIIEINDRPVIASHSFPWRGSLANNRVAESIIDISFESSESLLFDNIYFDHSIIHSSLMHSGYSELSLPSLSADMKFALCKSVGRPYRPEAKHFKRAISKSLVYSFKLSDFSSDRFDSINDNMFVVFGDDKSISRFLSLTKNYVSFVEEI